MNRSALTGRRVLVAAVASTALVSAGGSWAVAASQDDRSPADKRGLAAASTQPTITGTSTQGACKVGFDTQNAYLTPPDDLTSDNTPAGSVTMKKQCAGAVVAEFSSEVSATSSTTPGSLHLDVRATCTGTGGFADPCTVGEVATAAPGHVFLQDGATTSPEVNSMQMVFPALKRGLWRFEALPGSYNASTSLGYRTFVVTAYTGG